MSEQQVGIAIYCGEKYRLIELGHLERTTNAGVGAGDVNVVNLTTDEEWEDSHFLQKVVVKGEEITLLQHLCNIANWSWRTNG